MAKLLVSDALWALIEPVIPPHPPRPKGGKPPVDDRVCLTGILFVLKTGIPWEDFPQENNAPSIAPSTTIVASCSTPRTPMALSIVSVFQWPCGLASTQRIPPKARPLGPAQQGRLINL